MCCSISLAATVSSSWATSAEVVSSTYRTRPSNTLRSANLAAIPDRFPTGAANAEHTALMDLDGHQVNR